MLHDRTTKRIGFTLVEILVVVAIITVLAGLGAWAFFGMIGRTHSRNTEATMKVVNKLMLDRWSAVIADAKKESISPTTHVNVFALANGDVERARVIWIKARLVEAFPITYAEVQTPSLVISTYIIPTGKQKPHFAKYQALLAGKVGGGPGESSACLLMALKTLGSDGVSIGDQLSYAVANTDGVPSNGPIPTLIDGWGKPMAFFRFATGAQVQVPAVNPAAVGSTAFKYSDPTDGGGKLLTPNWYVPQPGVPNPNRVTFEDKFHAISSNNGTTANYVIPVIVSAGPDGKFGLKNFDFVNGNDVFPLSPELSIATPPPTPFDKDNIYSYTLRGD